MQFVRTIWYFLTLSLIGRFSWYPIAKYFQILASEYKFILIQFWYDLLPGNQQGGTSMCPHHDPIVEMQGQIMLL